MGTPNAVTVRWQTDVATDSVVRYGVSAGSLTSSAKSTTSRTEHELRLTGLSANKTYYYSVGSSAAVLAGGADGTFVTAPTTAKPTRVWLLGSAGSGSAGAKAVRDAYYRFAGTRHTDLWLMAGDNGFSTGTDAEFTSKFFGVYGSMLKTSVLWSAFGDRDAAASDAGPQTGPYFRQHTFPTKGEAGGVASDTEAYYAFDYGDIHFLMLDSAESSCAVGSPQLLWLKRDLAANRKAWTVAVVHHSPYTRGPEHSDGSTSAGSVRQNILPILESHGVDLVIGGHAPGYERSYFINGHYGLSPSFDRSAMVVQSGNGRIDGDGAYVKDTEIVVTASGTRLTLEWDDNSDNEDGFRIERAVAGGAFVEIGRVGENVAIYVDTTVVAGKTYSYRVSAYSQAGASAFSNIASGTAPPPAPQSQVDNAFSGTVYLVVGASGQTGSTVTPHPVMVSSLNVLGSLVMDFNGGQLDVQYLDTTGARRDYFTVRKKDFVAPAPAPANRPPDVRITSPAAGTRFSTGAAVKISATAADTGGHVSKVEFFAAGKPLGTDTTSPFEIVWSNVHDGAHTLTARATDNAGAATTSAPVLVNVSSGAAVTGFTLINAQTGQPVPGYTVIAHGAMIPRKALPSQLSIRVNTNPLTVGSVRIGWAGNSNYRIESQAPYALFAGPGQEYYAGPIANGTHTITATPFSKGGATGVAGKPVTVSFTIADQAPPVVAPAPVGNSVTSFTLINADTDAPVAGYQTIANGAVISRASLPTSRLSIRVNTHPATVGSVRIGWNTQANYRTESEAPYALFGGPRTDYAPGTIANGTHTVTATPFTLASARGIAGRPLSVTFRIQ